MHRAKQNDGTPYIDYQAFTYPPYLISWSFVGPIPRTKIKRAIGSAKAVSKT